MSNISDDDLALHNAMRDLQAGNVAYPDLADPTTIAQDMQTCLVTLIADSRIARKTTLFPRRSGPSGPTNSQSLIPGRPAENHFLLD